MRRTDEGTLVFDVPLEEPTPSPQRPALLERFLRAAATSVGILLRSVRPPGS